MSFLNFSITLELESKIISCSSWNVWLILKNIHIRTTFAAWSVFSERHCELLVVHLLFVYTFITPHMGWHMTIENPQSLSSGSKNASLCFLAHVSLEFVTGQSMISSFSLMRCYWSLLIVLPQLGNVHVTF